MNYTQVITSPGYYNMTYFNYPLSLSDLGPKVTSWYEDGVWEVQASISSYHNDDREGYKFLDTAKENCCNLLRWL